MVYKVYAVFGAVLRLINRINYVHTVVTDDNNDALPLLACTSVLVVFQFISNAWLHCSQRHYKMVEQEESFGFGLLASTVSKIN